jgi:O-antigen/teichoic acid export membrane protein
MAAKLALTLFMGRFFAVDEMGLYGLVMGGVVTLSILLGQRLDFVVNRDIVGADGATVFARLRDETVVYLVNHAVLAIVFLGLAVGRCTGFCAALLLGLYLLSVLENLSAALYGHFNALGRQVFANVLFFFRAGLWIVPFLVVAALDPSFRTTHRVVVFWLAGSGAGFALALWGLRRLPWREGLARPVDWIWVRHGLRQSLPVWGSNLALSAGLYVDRFIAAHYIDLQAAGLVTFYTSFTMALFALVQSGVLAFVGPRLVLLHKQGDEAAFEAETAEAGRHVRWSTAGLVLLVGVGVPLFGYLAGRPLYYQNAGLLFLLLAGTFLRGWADLYYNVLFARQQDRAIWLGDLLFLVPTLAGNALFVPFFGLWGLGLSSVLASAFLLAWRAFWSLRARPARPSADLPLR